MKHQKPKNHTFKDARILIVDDTITNRMLLHEIFKSAGFTNIEEANDGQEAMDKMIAHPPALLLLDIIMPKKDGFEVLNEIRDHQQLKEMVIILQTGSDKQEDKKRAFDAGATDFISKPINDKEVLARSQAHLEKYLLIQELRKFNNRIKEELSSATKLQKDILPSEEFLNKFKKKYSADIAQYYQPSSELGGDFWGIKFISDTKFAIYNVDFSGHGITSALNTFRLQIILQNEYLYSLNPADFLERINVKFNKMLPTEQFATMFYGIVDIKSEEICYSVAASPSPIILSGGKIKILSGKGYPLGIVKEPGYKNHTIKFSKNDFFLLYSDALIETCNSKEKFLKEKDIADLIKIEKNKTCSSKMSNILKNFRKWTDSSKIDDDLTVVMLSLK